MSVSAGTLEPFIDADELRSAIAEPDLGDEQAEWLCEWGSAAVRAEVGQMVNLVHGDRVVLDGTGSSLILLPELEVRNVESVTLAGTELDPAGYEWNGAGCLWRLGPGRRRALGRWPHRARAVEVVYDHGWGPPSPQWEAARAVALEIAARTFRNPGMLQSERIGDYSRAWVPTGGRAQLTPVEKSSLDILRRGV